MIYMRISSPTKCGLKRIVLVNYPVEQYTIVQLRSADLSKLIWQISFKDDGAIFSQEAYNEYVRQCGKYGIAILDMDFFVDVYLRQEFDSIYHGHDDGRGQLNSACQDILCHEGYIRTDQIARLLGALVQLYTTNYPDSE